MDQNAGRTMQRVGGLATIPAREKTLHSVIASIVPQLNTLHVVLNGYTHVPDCVKHSAKVVYWLEDNSKGDAKKFMMADCPDCYYFSFDDDLIYPFGYCDYMVKGIDTYDAIVTLHGRNYPRPVISFRKWSANYRCLGTVTEDVKVDLGGSGCMAFSTKRFKIQESDFKDKNMADVFIAQKAHEQDIPIMVLKHRPTYLQYLPQKRTIWMTTPNVNKQTEILKSFLT